MESDLYHKVLTVIGLFVVSCALCALYYSQALIVLVLGYRYRVRASHLSRCHLASVTNSSNEGKMICH